MSGRDEAEHKRAVAELLHDIHDQLLGLFSERSERKREVPAQLLLSLQQRLRAPDESPLLESASELEDDAQLATLLRELSLLRAAIVEACDRHEIALRGEAARLVHAALDDAMMRAAQASERATLAEIQAGHARIEALFTLAPSAIALLEGPEHRFVFANARYHEVIDGADPVGKTLREVMPQLATSAVVDLLDEVLSSGRPRSGHEQPVTLLRDGVPEERLFTFSYAPYRDLSGAVTGVAVFANDVTSEVTARRAAEASAAEFFAIIQSIPDSVFVGDASGIRYVNRSALSRVGFDDVTDMGRPHNELLSMLDVRSSETGEPIASKDAGFPRALAGESSTSVLSVRNVSSGELVIFRATYAPVRLGERVIGAVAVHTDITEQKRVEERRERLHTLEQRARQEAENANRIKDEFIATVSHELRTPLSAILGWARLLTSGTLPPEKQRQAFVIVERNAKAQAQLIEDLLDVSRILSGKLRLEVTVLSPLDVVEAALDVVRSTADAKGVKLESILDPHAGPLMGDPDRLQQVFWNLLTNAVKFTPKGGRIQVRLQRVDSHVELVIEDNGAGIDAEFLPFVFEKFRQAETAATKVHRGLGLGLSIVKYLVEAHGGTIHADSAGVGKGARFVVRLPLSPVRQTPTPVAPETPRASAPAIECPLVLRDLRVLVVDDEEDARGLLVTVLEQCRAIVTTARDVPSALSSFQQSRPDVIVSDIGMPGSTGYDLIRQIRLLSPADGGNTPAVALTAYARVEDRMKALASGFNMHVAKPIEPAELLVVIASVVARTL